jgi:hypothetical protein
MIRNTNCGKRITVTVTITPFALNGTSKSESNQCSHSPIGTTTTRAVTVLNWYWGLGGKVLSWGIRSREVLYWKVIKVKVRQGTGHCTGANSEQPPPDNNPNNSAFRPSPSPSLPPPTASVFLKYGRVFDHGWYYHHGLAIYVNRLIVNMTKYTADLRIVFLQFCLFVPFN